MRPGDSFVVSARRTVRQYGRPFFALVIAGLTLAVLVFYWAGRNVKSIPGGGTIELFAITHNTNHTVTWGASWRTELRKRLPYRIARRIDAPVRGVAADSMGPTPNEALVFWFRIKSTQHYQDRFMDCVLLDAEGKPFETNNVWSNFDRLTRDPRTHEIRPAVFCEPPFSPPGPGVRVSSIAGIRISWSDDTNWFADFSIPPIQTIPAASSALSNGIFPSSLTNRMR